MTGALLERLKEYGIEYKEQYSLKESCTFRVGGCCSLAVFPKSEDEIALAVDISDRAGVDFCVVGKGSNTLFSDGKIDKILIFTGGCDDVRFDGNTVLAFAGAGLIALSSAVAEKGLSGLEFASGIPGSVGGAVFMNAGAYGSCMADVTAKSRAFDRRIGTVVTLEQHGFGYRDSIYKRERSLICLSVALSLIDGDTTEIRQRMRELSAERRKKQPLEYPSAGSYFKRPQGDFAGRLIEECGLKGMRIGGAEVSVKHAGFIVNRGNATFSDILALEERVKETVYRQCGVELEREVEIID